MIYLPQRIPAAVSLRAAGFDIHEYNLHDIASHPQSGSRVLLLNLMPHKERTDLDIARTFALTGRDVVLMPMKISGQTYKTTPQSYVEAFYLDFEEYAADTYDGIIVTGAPVEHLPFAEVRYWSELCRIINWSQTHVGRRLYICWGAQAALFHLYGIPKYPLDHKCFGIYSQHKHPAAGDTFGLLQGMTPSFPMPHSRHTEVRAGDFVNTDAYIVADGDESGVGVVVSHDGRDVFVLGHFEYAADTLDREYHRDLGKGLSIALPEHYYVDNNPANGINYSWQHSAVHFYTNWLQSPMQQSME